MRRYLLVLLAALMLTFSAAPVQGGVEMPLDQLIDGFFAERMAEQHIPGAVFVLVKDGKVVHSRGYGFANLESGVRADPDHSLFRVASVSKLFATMAVLQLAERGQVSLTDSVTRYVPDLPLVNPFDRPLTVRDLLLHTDGFEERNTRIFALSPEGLPGVGETLRTDLKPLFAQPGEMITYGSFGSAVASYLVQTVSGMPFEQYVEQHLLKPLGMERTTLLQEQRPDVATVYRHMDDQYVASPYLYITTPATGGASATAADMGRLIAALLQGDAAGVLSRYSVEAMFQQQFTPHPGLPGVTYGFFEHVENGRKGIVREGSGLGVGSRIFLWPEQNLGFFVACNTRSDELGNELTSLMLDHFAPAAAPAPAPAQVVDSARFAGTYRYVQYSRHTVSKVSAVMAGLVRVTPNADGTVTMKPLGMGDPYGGFEEPTRWAEVEPGLFHRSDGKGAVAFRTGSDGHTYLYSAMGYHGTYERLTWYQMLAFHLGLILLLGGLFLVFAVVAAFGLWGLAGWTRGLAGVVSLLGLLFLVAVLPAGFNLGGAAGFPSIAFVDAPNPVLSVLANVPFALSLLTAGLAAFTWWPAAGPTGGRMAASAVVLTSAAFLAFVRYWNLWGLRL